MNSDKPKCPGFLKNEGQPWKEEGWYKQAKIRGKKEANKRILGQLTFIFVVFPAICLGLFFFWYIPYSITGHLINQLQQESE